jgi:hypothetical protein
MTDLSSPCRLGRRCNIALRRSGPRAARMGLISWMWGSSSSPGSSDTGAPNSRTDNPWRRCASAAAACARPC